MFAVHKTTGSSAAMLHGTNQRVKYFSTHFSTHRSIRKKQIAESCESCPKGRLTGSYVSVNRYGDPACNGPGWEAVAASRIGNEKRPSVKYRGRYAEESIPAMESESPHGMRESRLDHLDPELSTP